MQGPTSQPEIDELLEDWDPAIPYPVIASTSPSDSNPAPHPYNPRHVSNPHLSSGHQVIAMSSRDRRHNSEPSYSHPLGSVVIPDPSAPSESQVVDIGLSEVAHGTTSPIQSPEPEPNLSDTPSPHCTRPRWNPVLPNPVAKEVAVMSKDELKLRFQKRKVEIAQTLRTVEMLSRTVDVCFLAHKSCLGVWEKLKGGLCDVNDVLGQRFARCQPSVSFLGYGSGSKEPIEFQPMRTPIKRSGFWWFRRKTSSSTLAEATATINGKLKWRSGSTRVIFHIGSQPLKQTEWELEALHTALGKAGQLTVFEITTKPTGVGLSIPQMFTARQSHRDPISVPINLSDRSNPHGSRTVADCITAGINWATRVLGREASLGLPSSDPIDTTSPTWASAGEEAMLCEVVEYLPPMNVVAIQRLTWVLNKKEFEMKIAVWRRPFARGLEFELLHGRLLKPDSKQRVNIIVKRPIPGGAKVGMKHLLLELEKECIARYLADCFNSSVKNAGFGFQVQFLKARLFTLATTAPQSSHTAPLRGLMYSSSRVTNQFTVFSNHSGGVMGAATKGAKDRLTQAQAFSHFTWHFTGTHHMVVDLHGWVDEERNTLLLTDPAIHSRNLLKFGTTNFSSPGFKSFFETHQCSEICQRLRLSRPH